MQTLFCYCSNKRCYEEIICYDAPMQKNITIHNSYLSQTQIKRLSVVQTISCYNSNRNHSFPVWRSAI